MRVFDFNRAIVRTAPRSVTQGLRAVDVGAPSYEGVLAEQAAHVRALEEAGITVDVLPALEAYPDSLFVEDTALVFPDAAIVLRPGAPSRRGEAAEIAPMLERTFARVLRLEAGSVDGGDVLTTERSVFIGQSARTSPEGAEALTALLAEIGRKGVAVETPPGVLHFKSDCSLLKSDCSLLDEETILATPRLAASGVFAGFRVILTPEGEEGAANAVRVNDRVLVSDAFPRTAEALSMLGFALTPLGTREIAKIDAGLSCLSLRWRA